MRLTGLDQTRLNTSAGLFVMQAFQREAKFEADAAKSSF